MARKPSTAVESGMLAVKRGMYLKRGRVTKELRQRSWGECKASLRLSSSIQQLGKNNPLHGFTNALHHVMPSLSLPLACWSRRWITCSAKPGRLMRRVVALGVLGSPGDRELQVRSRGCSKYCLLELNTVVLRVIQGLRQSIQRQ